MTTLLIHITCEKSANRQEYGRIAKLQPSVVLDETTQQLVDLVRRRRQLVEMRVTEQNRLDRVSKVMKSDIRDHIQREHVIIQ